MHAFENIPEGVKTVKKAVSSPEATPSDDLAVNDKLADTSADALSVNGKQGTKPASKTKLVKQPYPETFDWEADGTCSRPRSAFY